MDQFLLGAMTGVIVTLLTQLFTAIVIKPTLDIRELIGEIASALINYANVYGQLANVERKREAQGTFRKQASTLRAKANAAILTGRWSFGLLPKRLELVQASKHLIAISNYAPDTSGRPEVTTAVASLEGKIGKLLRITLTED